MASPGPAARTRAVGFALVLLSSAAFATSGPFAKSLLVTGWSPLALVTWRVDLAALVLTPAVLWLMRGRWRDVRYDLGRIAALGAVGMALCQLAYFSAVETLSVGVALLLEYAGIVLVALWLWVRWRRPPNRLTAAGITIAVVGLMLVLNVFTGARVSLTGVAWGLLAAVGLATYYLLSSHRKDNAIPALAMAGLGLWFAGAILTVMVALGLGSYTTATSDAVLAGHAFPWGLSIFGLAVIATATAYASGIAGIRLIGATVASTLGLTEVLFAVVFAWWTLAERPGLLQAFGGALVLLGVALVQRGEAADDETAPRAAVEPAPSGR